jgi:hypothetical protein
MLEGNTLSILDTKISEKLGTHIAYISIECKCGNRWGITPINGTIKPSQLVCKNCFADNLIRQ